MIRLNLAKGGFSNFEEARGGRAKIEGLRRGLKGGLRRGLLKKGFKGDFKRGLNEIFKAQMNVSIKLGLISGMQSNKHNAAQAI